MEIVVFPDEKDPMGQAIVNFSNDWRGFMNCAEFEKLFEIEHHGKNEWNAQKQILALTATGGVHALMTMMLKGRLVILFAIKGS